MAYMNANLISFLIRFKLKDKNYLVSNAYAYNKWS